MLRSIGLSTFLAVSCVPQALTAEQPPTADQATDREFRFVGLRLHVTDIKKSVVFYRDVLGFKLAFYLVGSAKEVPELSASDPEPYGASLLAGSQEIGLQRNSGEVRLPASGARYHFEVPDPAAYHARLEARGAVINYVIRGGPDRRPFMFSVNDPDGHWIFFRGPIGPSNSPSNQ